MEGITRYEFLRRLGFGGAALLTAICLGSCKDEDDDKNTPSAAKDFTLNLNQAGYTKLKTPGNFMVEQDVVIACVAPGEYAAVTVICSHEQQKQVAYQPAGKEFRCSAHGATFDTKGKVKSGPASTGLLTFNVVRSGDLLRIFS